MPESESAAERNRIAVVGGGPVGLALALALHQRGVAATVFDARARGAAARDPRVLALAYGSRLILENLGIWRDLPTTPIKTIHVSQQGGFGRARLTAQELGVPALGYVVGAGALAGRLDAAVAERGIPVRNNCRVAANPDGERSARLRLEGGEEIDAQLIAWAEGGISDRDATIRDYGQVAVICSAETAEQNDGTAYERFTPAGPLAALPHDGGWSIVYTSAAAEADALLMLDAAQFLARLQRHFGDRLHFTATGVRAAYPLLLRMRSTPASAGQVWLGNAAQTLHPVAGQGFNLALRDVAELARHVGQAAAAGHDCGGPGVLANYVASRRFDRRGVVGFTDGLVRLFSNEHPALRRLRGLGLVALDVFPPARDFVAKRMMFGARAWP
jgi:2-octaprenyl-6-methoxyphenol hydroxylase